MRTFSTSEGFFNSSSSLAEPLPLGADGEPQTDAHVKKTRRRGARVRPRVSRPKGARRQRSPFLAALRTVYED
ncbi:hypothetical protein VFPFJ_01458 [Purpureocillium lilacinum]|uniref:Uncharacterized protein n=1 Tax=Purpureocillium lilacinum TaxID=33203 RepID=A0A179I0R9_PURLI|nr:hypothetical protein VFPFJ_01458 [Purpureocillium lilacinum]OAQ95348.1 hypothetical protein VFPFJ_01458 [Purpureocillium lilacinum]